MLVPGLLGGARGGPLPALPSDILLLIVGGADSPLPPCGGILPLSPSPCAVGISAIAEVVRCGGPDGGLGAEVAAGGALLPLIVLGGPAALGGGGVADGVGVFSAPAFLLIQRLRSGSYTKEDCSPSLARMGLLGCEPMSASFFAPPLNQPPSPQPFFAGATSFARAA